MDTATFYARVHLGKHWDRGVVLSTALRGTAPSDSEIRLRTYCWQTRSSAGLGITSVFPVIRPEPKLRPVAADSSRARAPARNRPLAFHYLFRGRRFTPAVLKPEQCALNLHCCSRFYLFYVVRGNGKAHLIQKYLETIWSPAAITEGKSGDVAGICPGTNPLSVSEIKINFVILVRRREVNGC